MELNGVQMGPRLGIHEGIFVDPPGLDKADNGCLVQTLSVVLQISGSGSFKVLEKPVLLLLQER